MQPTKRSTAYLHCAQRWMVPLILVLSSVLPGCTTFAWIPAMSRASLMRPRLPREITCAQLPSSRQIRRSRKSTSGVARSSCCKGGDGGDYVESSAASEPISPDNGERCDETTELKGGRGTFLGHGATRAVGVVATWLAWAGCGRHDGVRPVAAFGGPSRPLNRCLVNAVNAQEFCRRLEADLAAGRNIQESRGMVKSILRGLNLQDSLKDAVLYLPGGKRQAAADAQQSAFEYLASVVEFDAWDKLDKDWTSNVALRNMTPDNVLFVRMALDAAQTSLDQFLRQFDSADVDTARDTYRTYFMPVEERETQQ